MSLNLNKIHKWFAAAVIPALVFLSCGKQTEEQGVLSSTGVVRMYGMPSIGVGRVVVDAETDPMPQIICIDPGHGFDDGGCSSEFLNGLNEDDITLAISLLLDEELRALGYQTVLTHDGKTFPITSAYDDNNKFKPEERTAYANSIDIDYYVSIHCNSYTDSSASGIRIYYYDGEIKKEHTSGAIADSINSGLLQTLEAGTKSETIEMTSNVYHVIRATTVPASLIEVGFVTNESDAAKMIDEEWQRAFAEGVAAGIDRYYRAEQN